MNSEIEYKTPQWGHCPWEKEVDGQCRYYRVIIHQDLWGRWILTRIWGGCRRQAGQVRHDTLDSVDQAARLVKDIARRRKAHGYRIVQNSNNPEETV